MRSTVFVYVFLALGASTLNLSMNLFNVTDKLLITRELGFDAVHIGYTEGVKTLTSVISMASSQWLFARVPLVALISVAHLVRILGFGIYSLACIIGTGTAALSMVYAGGFVRSLVNFMMIAPGVFLAVQVSASERPGLNALTTGINTSFKLAGPMLGSGLAVIAPTRLLAAAYPAWFSIALGCIVLFSTAFLAPSIPSGNQPLASPSPDATQGPSSTATPAIMQAKKQGGEEVEGAPKAPPLPTLSDAPYSILFKSLIAVVLFRNLSGYILLAMMSLILWESYEMDSDMQFVLFSSGEAASIIGSFVAYGVVPRVAPAKIMACTSPVIIVYAATIVNWVDLSAAPTYWRLAVPWVIRDFSEAISTAVMSGLFLTRFPGHMQPQVQSLMGMITLVPNMIAPFIGSTVYAMASTAGSAYNYVMLAHSGLFIASQLLIVLNWRVVVGGWNDPPVGQEAKTSAMV